MKRVLLFGGTTESHEIARWLSQQGLAITLCVAGSYAKEIMEKLPDLTVRVGRLDYSAMTEFMQNGSFSAVIDATHPYAKEVTQNIKAACKATKLKYFRFLREQSHASGVALAKSVEAAADMLKDDNGAVLIATGSKELAKYTVLKGFKDRCYPRVLPTIEALEQCAALGFEASHIIAMQGPFSKELNAALFRQLEIKTLVTKDGGKAGGFPEKLAAAEECGVKVIVIERPLDAGLSIDELKAAIKNYLLI